jgi:hypothetical protein
MKCRQFLSFARKTIGETSMLHSAWLLRFGCLFTQIANVA